MANLANAATTSPGTAPVNTAPMASNLFALDLYTLLRSQPGNLCISPYSISSALGMTSIGARGRTEAQMLAVLHWNDAPGRLPDAFGVLMNRLRGQAGVTGRDEHAPQVQIANSLFGQKGFVYHPDFLDLVSKQFGGGLQSVDFVHQPDQALRQINDWAAQQTHDRIKQALPASAITPLTRLILVNAIYFKAEWASTFNKAATSDQPFFVDGKLPANVPLMQQRQTFSYFENQSLQAMEMPYQGDYSMIVLLPRTHDGLPALENALTTNQINELLAGLKPQLLQVLLPRFKNQGSFGLSPDLKKLGMTDAFNPEDADFTGISSEDKLNIDDVIHKTFIEVDENGTEAAAVTAIIMRAAAMMPTHKPAEPIVFRADHPFMYLLRNRSTGTFLFMGRVTDPR